MYRISPCILYAVQFRLVPLQHRDPRSFFVPLNHLILLLRQTLLARPFESQLQCFRA